MGLDMYLEKTKKVEGLAPEKIIQIAGIAYRVKNEEDLKALDLVAETGVAEAALMLPAIKNRGTHFTYYSIFDEVAYWRKANHVHAWFVDNVQDGKDDCRYYPASKELLEKLHSACQLVLSNKEHAKTLLPTRPGFFFGDTSYDEYYFDDVKETKEALEKIFAKTDWENEILFYNSSW